MPSAPLLLLLGLSPPSNLAWEEIRSGATTVRCAPGASPWCVAEAILHAPASTLGRMLMDFPSYPSIFSRITEARALGPGLATFTMRLPAPLAPRDAVARFTTHKDGPVTRVDWSPAPDAAPRVSGVVRLTEYAGRWTLHRPRRRPHPGPLRVGLGLGRRRAGVGLAHGLVSARWGDDGGA